MPSIEKWHAQSLRATAFPSLEKIEDQQGTWEVVVGDSPNQVTTQPKINALQEQGEFGNGYLTYKVIPGRIEWLYQPFLSDKTVIDSFPELGLFTESLKEFKTIIIKWLEQCSNIKRIAFGAATFLPVESHEAAYRQLDEYLESVQVDPETSEFLYRINRKRKSKSFENEVMINRLATWKAIKYNLKINEIDTETSFACLLELDINNIPEEKLEFEKGSLVNLFNELVDLGIEIVNKGDVP